MSRIGKKPIELPGGVEVAVEGNIVTVKGPKGSLVQVIPTGMEVVIEAGQVVVKRPSEEKRDKAMHGLTRTLINNMIIGVTEQWKKVLEVNGVGYRAAKQGNKLALTVGKSHPVELFDTDDVKIEVPDPNHIVVTGCDKQKVGAFADLIKRQRPVEPYKGKGIRYEGERVKKKEGKTGSKK